MTKTCTECLHYHACRGTYYSAKGDGTLLYDFEGEMYGESGCEHFASKNSDSVVHAKWYDGRCTNCCHEALDYLDDCQMKTYITDYCPKCGAKMDGGELGG